MILRFKQLLCVVGKAVVKLFKIEAEFKAIFNVDVEVVEVEVLVKLAKVKFWFENLCSFIQPTYELILM